MKDILKIVKYLKDSGLLSEGVRETIKIESKEQKGRFLSMLLGTLGDGLLGNMLAGKGVIEKELLQLAIDLKDLHFKKFLIPLYPLTNFEIQMY